MLLIVIVVILFLYIINMKPKKADSRFKQSFVGKNIAHRGIFDKSVAENSLSALKRAVLKNCPVEIDVRLTHDGVPVVFHDSTLKRLFGADKKVSELDFDELSHFCYANGEHILSFSDALCEVSGNVPLLIEIKEDALSFKTAKAVLKELCSYKGSYAVQSFNPLPLLYFRLFKSEVPRGQLSGNVFKFEEKTFKTAAFVVTNLQTNLLTAPSFISFRFEDRELFSFKLLRAIYRPTVFFYTLKDSASLSAAKPICDGVIFEDDGDTAK